MANLKDRYGVVHDAAYQAVTDMTATEARISKQLRLPLCRPGDGNGAGFRFCAGAITCLLCLFFLNKIASGTVNDDG